jgi:hypothetical protein
MTFCNFKKLKKPVEMTATPERAIDVAVSKSF